jgi:hypothetical protein
MGLFTEDPGEQCTVVFALIVTEPASECVCKGGGATPPPPTSRFLNILCKDDSAMFSRFLHGAVQLKYSRREKSSSTFLTHPCSYGLYPPPPPQVCVRGGGGGRAQAGREVNALLRHFHNHYNCIRQRLRVFVLFICLLNPVFFQSRYCILSSLDSQNLGVYHETKEKCYWCDASQQVGQSRIFVFLDIGNLGKFPH